MPLRSRIVGTGGYVPPRVVPNAELARLTGMSPSAIYRRTGIKERRWVGPEEATSHLAQWAALAALEAAGVTPQALDAIILSTTSPDTPMPASACLAPSNRCTWQADAGIGVSGDVVERMMASSACGCTPAASRAARAACCVR